MPERYVFERLTQPPQPPDIEAPGCVTRLIHDVVSKGNLADLEELLERGAEDINAPDDNGHTPLHLATDVARARLLLDHGADPRLMHYNGYTPLHMAVQRCQLHGSDGALLDFYLDRLPLEALLQTTYHRQDSILHLAARGGMNNMTQVRKMIDLGVAVNALDLNSQTPLQMACESGNAGMARILIDSGADMAKSHDSVVYLNCAAYARSARIIDLLVDAGANVNAPLWNGMHTVLSIAAARDGQADNVEVIQSLLKAGADPNHRCSEDQTPLHGVTAASAAAILPLLLRAGADPNAQDVQGRTPMHTLIEDVRERRTGEVREEEEASLIGALKILLHAGANPELKDVNGKRPYERAYSYSMTLTMDFLQDVAQRNSRKGVSHGQRPRP